MCCSTPEVMNFFLQGTYRRVAVANNIYKILGPASFRNWMIWGCVSDTSITSGFVVEETKHVQQLMFANTKDSSFCPGKTKAGVAYDFHRSKRRMCTTRPTSALYRLPAYHAPPAAPQSPRGGTHIRTCSCGVNADAEYTWKSHTCAEPDRRLHNKISIAC